MKKEMSKQEAREKIDNFFSREIFSKNEVKKIKRLAMKYNLKLKEQRKKFCKKCFEKLEGKTRINKGYKTVKCEKCGYKNRWKLIK
jgi:RNase P subunit RPR2